MPNVLRYAVAATRFLAAVPVVAALALSPAATAEPSESPGPASASCRLDAEVVVWTGTDWPRIAQALAADRSACAEYWVSIPPTANDKKLLRFLQDDLIRNLGVHPVFELTLGELTGWVNSWITGAPGRTWYDAGVEFRKRMVAAGMSGPHETWLLNELDATTMVDGPRAPVDHFWPAFPRDGVRDVLRGLYEGAPGMDPLPGMVEIGIHFRHQNLPDVEAYKEQMKAFLEDDGFWAAVAPAIRWLGVEVYPDVRYWGVPGSTLPERRRYTEEYVFHLLELVRDAPAAAPAKELFERAYLPFLNAGYRAKGGDLCTNTPPGLREVPAPFVSCHGNTMVDAATMQHFVSEQVHTVRHYAGAHPQGSPAGRIGFSWQPCNRTSAQIEFSGCQAFSVGGFEAEVNAVAARLAASVRGAYGPGGASPMGACLVDGTDENWCRGEVPGAEFTGRWSIFSSWD